MKKKQLFSLRKLSVGIASVSLGTALVFGGNVQAETQSNPAQVATQKVDALQNLTQQQKDNFKKRIEQSVHTNQPVEAVVKDATELNDANAKDAAAVKKQVELAQNVANQQKQVQTAQNVAQEQVQKAQAEVNKLANISKETKAIYNNKIAKAGVADIPGIVKDAKAVDAQVELAKNVANQQKQIETAKNVANEQKQIELAKKVAKEQVEKAQKEVNALKNISKETKAKYNAKIAKAGVADIPGIVKDAKAEDYQVGVAKNVAKEQDQKARDFQVDLAKKVAKEQVEKAQKEVNALKNISKETKAKYNAKIAKAGVADIPGIVKDAKAEDYQVGVAKAVAKEQVDKGQAAVNKLTHLTKDQKAAFNARIAKAGVADIPAIVKEAQDLDAKLAKGVKEPVKKPAQNTTGKTTTGQTTTGKATTGKTTTNKVNNNKVTNNKAAQPTQKAAAKKAGNKQLPATGEQDQLLFGLLSGSLFASAGTLFLLNARRRKQD